MAYNVFKRPMFKRGGSTQGTGIMSHVEPRVNRAFGSPFPNLGVTQMPPQSQIDAFRQAEINRQNRLNKGFNILGPAFTMPEDYPGTVSDYRNMLTQQKQAEKEFEQNISGGIAELGQGQSAFDAIFAPVDAAMAAKKQAEKEKLLETKDVIKDEPAYKGTDIKSEVENESKMIKELLKDENYSKGELALLVAGALKEPGGITEKIDKARELAIPLAKKRREEDRAITLAAYKLAKEKEQQEIKSGKGTDYQRNLKDIARATSNQPGETRTEDEIYDSLLAAKSPGSEARIQTLTKLAPTLLDAASDISRLKKELEDARLKGSEKDMKRIQEDIDRKLNDIESVKDFPELDIVIPGLKQRVGLQNGGRANFAEGTEMEEDDIVASNVSFGSGSATTSEPVEQLGYKELRDRLPPEITDDVVNLLSNNVEALQEFAYIRTQDDVNSFNAKYGVNLIIPPTRT